MLFLLPTSGKTGCLEFLPSNTQTKERPKPQNNPFWPTQLPTKDPRSPRARLAKALATAGLLLKIWRTSAGLRDERETRRETEGMLESLCGLVLVGFGWFWLGWVGLETKRMLLSLWGNHETKAITLKPGRMLESL